MRNIFVTLCTLVVLVSFGQKTPTQKTQKNPFVQPAVTDVQRNCHTVEMEQNLQRKYPNRLSEEDFERALQLRIEEFRNARMSSEELYQIPTIVHVIHNGQAVGNGPNITAAQVNSQFDVLNEDFRRMGAGYNDHPDGADIFIEFIPATHDPEGNALPEPGIHRYNGGQNAWGGSAVETSLKPTTIWDPERYFNIWVVNFGGDLDDVLGYAQFPSLSGLNGLLEDEGAANTDGVIMGYQYFGTTGAAEAPFNGGRTTTHEVGHWLGLRHIWGDGDCNVDDYCADTPNAGEPNFDCPTGTDSCPNSPGADMIENYMDYTDDACMNIFTNDQKARMRTVMSVSPRRKSLAVPPCSEAVTAVIGTNEATPPQWFTYTAASAEVLTISSVGQTTDNTYLTVYGACDEDPIVQVDDVRGSLQSEFSMSLEAGETVKLFWSGKYAQDPFNWQLSSSASASGKSCASAATAISGVNTMPINPNPIHWFTFTQPDASAKITLTMANSRMAVYSNSCDELELKQYGNSPITLLDIAQGEQIFIAAEPNVNTLSWNIEVAPLQAGEACATAAMAVEGTNTTPSTPYWFTYTMTEEIGSVTISSTGQNTVATSAKIYDGCDGELLSDNRAVGEQTEITINLELNDVINILWENEEAGSFDWTLSESAFAGGEACENPKEAVIGTNTVDDLDVEYFWTNFTVPESDKKLVITSTANEIVYIHTPDCNNLELLFSGENNATAIGLEENQEVLIVWEQTNGVGFNWNLAMEDLVLGDLCELPKQAVVGSNTAIRAPQWFNYTMPKSGGITISSEGSSRDTYLYVYDACNGELLGENDDIDFDNDIYQSTVLLTNVDAGQALYIFWSDEWSTSSFTWSIALQVNNTAPSISPQTFSLDEIPQNNDIIGTVEATDPDEDNLTFSIQSGNGEGIFNIDASTGELSVANASLLTTDKQLTIAITDQVVTRTATITVDLTYVLSIGADAALKIYPNPAKEAFTIDGGGLLNWSSGDLTDISGKSVMRIAANQQVVNTSSLPEGMYLLRLETNEGVMVRRVVFY